MKEKVSESVLQRKNPWFGPKVVELQQRFDSQFEEIKSQDDIESLFVRFFGSDGYVEEALFEIACSDTVEKTKMKEVFELVLFRSYIHVVFFFNDFSESLVDKWEEERGFETWVDDTMDFCEEAKELRKKFDEEMEKIGSMIDFFQLKAKFLGSDGLFQEALLKTESKNQYERMCAIADLFYVKAYMDYSLFAMEFSIKAESWPDSQVRALAYRFERELMRCSFDEDFKAAVVKFRDETVALKNGCTISTRKALLAEFERLLIEYSGI